MAEPEITYPWWTYVLAVAIVAVPVILMWLFGSDAPVDSIPSVIGSILT